MIRDRNLDPNTDAAKHVVSLNFSAGASLTAVELAAVRMPFTGKILTVHVRASTLTDADDSARIDIFKNAASILGATVDPVAAVTTTAIVPTTLTFVEGDILSAVVTTGAGDALVASVTIVARPYTGAAERNAAKAAGVVLVP